MSTKQPVPKPGSLKHAAAKIGCSVPTLYELIDAGKLRSYHIGRAHRVSDQAIADCIALLERENQERAAGGTLPRTRFLGAKAANDGNLRTALTNVASDKCA
jgi:excisionase family DNA binding protein